MNRNENSENFFSYVCNSKKIKELFASTLDGIPISVRCVSFVIVVFNAKFALLLAAHANKKDDEKRRSQTRVPCFASRNTLTFNFYRSLHCAHKNESIIYLPTIYASQQYYKSMAGKKRLFTGYPAAKHPKHSEFAITDIREKPVKFFCCSTRASTLVSAITSLAQVPMQFIFIIPWCCDHHLC